MARSGETCVTDHLNVPFNRLIDSICPFHCEILKVRISGNPYLISHQIMLLLLQLNLSHEITPS